MKQRTLWVTRTGVLIALLVIVQALTAGLGNQFVTGSLVNLILVVSVMLCDVGTGAAVAVLSPVFAKLFGIGPLPQLIPVVMLGNVVLVLVWFFVCKKMSGTAGKAVACAAAAVCKFLVLFIGITKIALPLLGLPDQKAAVISAMFSYPQLITAAIGGALALLILPVLKKAIKQAD